MTSLEAIKYLKENKRRHWLEGDLSKVSLESIENDLKVLELIKEKKVDIAFLVFLGIYSPLEEYNRWSKCKLTPEEFNLIVEWIERK